MARTRFSDYLALTKPRLASLAIFSAFVGFYSASEGPLDFARLLRMLCGTAFVAAAAMTLNQWMEADRDQQMQRTALRPIASGRMPASQALGFGLMLALAGFWILAGLGLFPVAVAAAILASYLGIYTPLKTRTPLCTLVGAVPGALPPLIGWSAATGGADFRAWVLFSVIFLWQMPHFLAINWLYREDFQRAGFRMLSAEDPEGRAVGRQMLLYGSALLPVSLLPTFLGMAGPVYFIAALSAGSAATLLLAVNLRKLDSKSKLLFRMSIAHLTLLLLALVLDKA